jgi:hypothetical protein
MPQSIRNGVGNIPAARGVPTESEMTDKPVRVVYDKRPFGLVALAVIIGIIIVLSLLR